KEQWWLGASSVWGQEILDALDTIEALVYRGQFVFVGQYGRTHVSGNWSRNYEARDRSRRDEFYEPTDEDTLKDNSDNSVLHRTTWKIPDGNDFIQYHVSYKLQCYTIQRYENHAYDRDPMERLRLYVNLLDRADRVLELEMFEGKECVGFEISASKYGNNPKEWIDRVWLDVESKLPVRIERHGRPVSRPGETSTLIDDQFEYYSKIPADVFEPTIPEDFINAEPGDIRASREREEKGEMRYADVPKGLRDGIVSALQDVNTIVYQEHYDFLRDENWESSSENVIYISQKDWRKDSFLQEEAWRTEWFVIDQNDLGQKGFDFNLDNFSVIQTVVDYKRRSYKVIPHGRTKHPDNPMDQIIFIAGLVDKADDLLENVELEGVKCYWFEISAKKYGTNPDTSKHRLWIDAETLLPVRTEFEWMQDDGPRIHVREEFEWDPELPEDTFTPVIPEGFMLIESDKK
ncbi:MAG: LolA family protein, partial [Planctomycetota bacterium]